MDVYAIDTLNAYNDLKKAFSGSDAPISPQAGLVIATMVLAAELRRLREALTWQSGVVLGGK